MINKNMNTREEIEARRMYDNSAGFYHDYRTKVNPRGWFFNELLEMPTSLDLLGEVKNKKILDYGCGSGIYAKILKRKGANVKGFDISKEMLKIAKKNNPDIEFKQGSGYNIPFKSKFDIIIAPLVVHYMKNWDRMFKEMKRVLNNKGIVIFSTGNPVYEVNKTLAIKSKKYKVLGINSYFKESLNYNIWVNPYNHKKIKAPFYHKTYETIIKTILRNGFEIIDYKDCFPLKKAKRLFPKEFSKYSKMPIFMVFKLRKK